MRKLTSLGLLLAAVTLAGCAHQQGQQRVERKHYNPWESDIGYAQVVRVGSTLYLSGITSGKETFEGQLEDIYKTITAILEDYHVDTTAVVKETIFTKDIEALKSAIPLRKGFYPNKNVPSSTWVQVDRLFMPDHLLEIEVIAVLPEGGL